MPVAEWRPERATNGDRLVGRLERLATADPPLLIDSHPVTRRLVTQPSPLADTASKHREALIDALLSAWTASRWSRPGPARCEVLARPAPGPAATIIAPARPEQRR